jgi:hypothetical protein
MISIALADSGSYRHMLAHGFTDEMLARLVRDGLATGSPGSIHASGRSMKVTWLRITDAGRRALAG